MMLKAADFEKVSIEEFRKLAPELMYVNVIIPERATAGSAGYDFITPVDIHLAPGEAITVPTGIRARIDEGIVLLLFPRSGLSFKYHMRLANTIGVVDSDYYDAHNQGHILIRVMNGDKDDLNIKAGERFCQGIFIPFCITRHDHHGERREGGFGSTGL